MNKLDMKRRLPRVLAISSGGGHWVQLLRLRPAFEDCDVHYATVNEGYRSDIDDKARFYIIPDSNRTSKIQLLLTAISVLVICMRVRPDVVVTTGAAPGYMGARIGKILGSRVIWLDSIANADELSLSGVMAGKHVDLWLTQWPHLEKRCGPHYHGSVI